MISRGFNLNRITTWLFLAGCVLNVYRVDAFSAHLTRPWDGGVRLSFVGKPIKTKKQRRKEKEKSSSSSLEVALVHSSTVEIGEEEEVFTLQTEEDEEVLTKALSGQTTKNKSAATTSSPSNPSMRDFLRELLGMSRPSNFLGVVQIYLLGVYMGLKGTTVQLLPTLLKPRMIAVLSVCFLTTCASMMVNDYYDAKSGVDESKVNKPMVSGQVPPAVVKKAISCLYAATLLGMTVVPGAPARMSVAVSCMLTFWYTKHLKPVTWLKNLTCATIMSGLPLTAGLSALSVSGIPQSQSIANGSLWRLVGMLFFGFMGREITMDIKDIEDDRKHQVLTIPVRYGREFASLVALVCTVVMSALSVVGSTKLIQWALASGGSFAMLRRAWQVCTNDNEKTAGSILDTAIEEGKTSLMLLLVSFALS